MGFFDHFKKKEEPKTELERTPEGFIKIPVQDLVTKAVWQGSEGFGEGAIVSDKITKEGYKVGYFYRDEPNPNYPDSGWRFWAGDEDEAYTDNPNNHHIFALNTIANYDPDIIPHLSLPVGSQLIRQSGGQFVLDDGSLPICIEKQER